MSSFLFSWIYFAHMTLTLALFHFDVFAYFLGVVNGDETVILYATTKHLQPEHSFVWFLFAFHWDYGIPTRIERILLSKWIFFFFLMQFNFFDYFATVFTTLAIFPLLIGFFTIFTDIFSRFVVDFFTISGFFTLLLLFANVFFVFVCTKK